MKYPQMSFHQNCFHKFRHIRESDDFDLDIVELGRGENHSLNELAKMFEWGYTYIPKRPGEANVTLCDTSIAKKDIGYEPKVNLKDYIKEVISE